MSTTELCTINNNIINNGNPPAGQSALQAYLAQVNNIALLSHEAQHDLAVRYREQGDNQAAYHLVTANLRLVVKIAMEYHHRWMVNVMDLIQEGNLGLMQAVKKFDPHRGVKLTSYASYWIKAYIVQFIMHNWRLIKIGTTRTQRKLFFNLKKEKRLLEEKGYEPDSQLLAKQLGTTDTNVVEMEQRMGDWEISLDQPATDKHSESQGERFIGEDQAYDRQLADAELHDLLHAKLADIRAQLNSKEKEILDKRLLTDEPATLLEIGKAFGITKERVRQIEKKLLEKLRAHMLATDPEFELSMVQA